jgi:hypothetical protein
MLWLVRHTNAAASPFGSTNEKEALLQIVWLDFHSLGAKGGLSQGFAGFSRVGKLGMN